MKEPFGISVLFPLLTVIVIVGFGGGLGVLFMFMESLHWDKWGVPWGVVGLGMSLVIGVPTVAALLQKKLEQE